MCYFIVFMLSVLIFDEESNENKAHTKTLIERVYSNILLYILLRNPVINKWNW